MVRRYIIYIHPTQENPASNQLARFFQRVSDMTPNNALNYPYHITLTSFFNSEDLVKIREAVIKTGDYTIAVLNPRLRETKTFIGIDVDIPGIKNWLQYMENTFNLVPKVNFHITLAHKFIEYNREEFLEIISEEIRPEEWTVNDWEIVLWMQETSQNTNKWTNLT